jgi:hypothetical protein
MGIPSNVNMQLRANSGNDSSSPIRGLLWQLANSAWVRGYLLMVSNVNREIPLAGEGENLHGATFGFLGPWWHFKGSAWNSYGE